jgi:hypothetical protein
VSPLSVALVYAGIPLSIILVLFLGVYGKSLTRQTTRYRPGRPWNHSPVWYVPHPEALPNPAPARAQIEGSSSTTTATGGASGEW